MTISLPSPLPETASSLDYLGSEVGLTTVLLAAIAVLIAILALPIFLYLRHHAAAVADQAAKDALEKMTANMEKEAITRIEAMLPALVSDYMSWLQGSVDDSAANQIAEAEAAEVEGDADSGGNPPGAD